jgi:hypothetical protein
MTVHVLGVQADGPGKGRTTQVVGAGSRTMKLAVYDYNCGTDNYTTGGNDISDIWDDFADVLYIGIEQMDTNTAADRREVTIDYTAKTLLLYDAFVTEETASDQGVVTVRLLVVGSK